MESNKRIMYAIELNNLEFLEEWKESFWNRFLYLYPKFTDGKGFRTKNVELTEKERFIAGPISEHLKRKIMVVFIFNQESVPIHADGVGSDVAIQIPFMGCNEETQTHFYDYNDDTSIELAIHENIASREVLHQEKLKRVQTYSMLNKPVLFRSGWAHNVTSTFKGIRIIYSWRFKEEYTWEAAKEICKQYL